MKVQLTAIVVLCLALSLPLFGSGAKDWEERFKDPKKCQAIAKGFFVLKCPKTFMAPGPKPPAGGEKADAFLPELESMTEEKLLKLKETKARFEKEKAAGEKKVANLKAEFDEESLEYAEKVLNESTRQYEEYSRRVKLAEDYLAEKKERLALAKLGKKPKPKKKEFHEASVAEYFALGTALDAATRAVGSLEGIYASYDTNIWKDGQCKIYVLTDPKEYAALKAPAVTPDLTPCISLDRKGEAMLVLASPGGKNGLGAPLAYAATWLFLDAATRLLSPNTDLCDAVRAGLCASFANLDFVPAIGREETLPYLEGEKLFLTQELFLTPKLDTPEKRVYYLRQSKAVGDTLRQCGGEKLARYISKATGGNSGLRLSFENLQFEEAWGRDFDDFCDKLPERVFWFLTKEAVTDKAAVEARQNKWKTEDAGRIERLNHMKSQGKI